MSTVSSFSALSSAYRSYPTSNTGNGTALPVNTRLGTSAPQADLNSLSSGQDTDATASTAATNSTPPPPPTSDSTDASGIATGPVVTSSEASADYRTLAKDLQSDNVAAIQVDEQKLQQDLAVTQIHSTHHHRGSGSTLNVTV